MDIRRPYKRPAISDQQRRREISLLRQAQNRQDVQNRARNLASAVLSFETDPISPDEELSEIEPEIPTETRTENYDVLQASKLKGRDACRWFAKQLMFPEWMIDVPDNLITDWYVFARPAGKRCLVVSSNGITVSRMRNGSLLHRFPSALPNGSRNNRSGTSYCILDCIFHEPDQTYYVVDMVCWAGMSFYECPAEFRFFWLKSKLFESGASETPSVYHRFRFVAVSVYNCDQQGLQTAYLGPVPYVKDGLLFYNKHAHYQMGNTPLTLVWKDDSCSQYVIDTDNKGQVPDRQQVVLELLEDGRLATSDDPPAIFGSLNEDFIQKAGLKPGNLLRFAVSNDGLHFANGKLGKADLQYLNKVNRARTFADSYSKVLFQHTARSSPLGIDHLFASISSSGDNETAISDAEMIG